jgi:glycosyltransferase involved in cell wall biosynthesis
LLGLLVEEFLWDPDDPRRTRHTIFGQTQAITTALLERGYALDVISDRRSRFPPRARYDLFFGGAIGFEGATRRLNADCIKIVRLEFAHWLFNNHASLGRSLAVQQRRGITPQAVMQLPNRAIELADYGVLLGNEFTYGTYAFAGKPIFELPNPALTRSPWSEDKDFDACRRRFIWLGSRCLAHQGLDRVLEAFAGMADFHLTVCGPVAEWPDFVAAYHKELHETPNIRLYGWIDITSPEFHALAGSSLCLVFPSCAEAQAGAVVSCMQAGLIPMVSRESGVDVDPDFGVLLPDCDVDTIARSVRELAERPVAELAAMARRTWEIAQAVYTPERYQAGFGAIIDRIVAEHPRLTAEGFIRLPALPDRPRQDPQIAVK